MENYEFYDYYEKYIDIETKAKDASICVQTNPISNIHQEISDFYLLLGGINYDWDDEVESDFSSVKSEMYNNLTLIMTSLNSYKKAESIYILLSDQLEILKQRCDDLKKMCQKKPNRTSSIYYDIKNDEKIFLNSKYQQDLTIWRTNVKGLKTECQEMCDKIDEWISELEKVDSIKVMDGKFDVSTSFNAVEHMLFDMGNYGLNQNITHAAINGYTLVSSDLIMQYIDKFELTNNISIRTVNFLNKLKNGNSVGDINYDVFQDLSLLLFEEIQDIETVSSIMSSSFKRSSKDKSNDEEVVSRIMKTYNVDEFTSWMILDSMNTTGICTYSAAASYIFAEYEGRAGEFERDFGFPMYYEGNDGNHYYNGEMLMSDLYIYLNSTENPGLKSGVTPYFVVDKSGNLTLSATNQLLLDDNDASGCGVKTVSNYLLSKNPDLIIDSSIKSSSDFSFERDADELKGILESAQANGYQLKIGLSGGNLYSSDRELAIKPFQGRHAMYITNVTDDGIYLSSWGEKYYISYENLDGRNYNIEFIKVEGIYE